VRWICRGEEKFGHKAHGISLTSAAPFRASLDTMKILEKINP
jgi:hypothetical protein